VCVCVLTFVRSSSKPALARNKSKRVRYERHLTEDTRDTHGICNVIQRRVCVSVHRQKSWPVHMSRGLFRKPLGILWARGYESKHDSYSEHFTGRVRQCFLHWFGEIQLSLSQRLSYLHFHMLSNWLSNIQKYLKWI